MKKILITLIFLLFNILLFSQEQNCENKKSYISNENIYWNKDLPITITLSSPNNDEIKLEKPFYLDTESLNYLRTKWEMDSTGKYIMPLQEQLWEIYGDSEPPKTKSRFIAKTSYIYKDKKYYSDDLKVELISTDKLSGVQKTYYSINDSSFVLYDSFITFEVGIDINLKYYSVDNVGNIENIVKESYDYDNNKLKFGVDNKAPETFVITAKNLLSPSDKLKIESFDFNGVGVHSTYYKIDSGEFIQYDKPINLNNNKNGKHIIYYYSQDWINNKEDVKSFSYFVDAIAPEINLSEKIVEDELTNLRHITISSTDNMSGVFGIYVQLVEGNEYMIYNKPFYVDIRHQTLKIKAVDCVGNESIRIIKYSQIK